LGQEPDYFKPIDLKPSNPEGSTETPMMGEEDPSQKAARELAELLTAAADAAAKAVKCMVNVAEWPSK
jgi:hypothetical protein